MTGPNHQEAWSALHESVKRSATFTPKKLPSAERTAIDAVILGDHLTFRYILMTALLAKVVDRSIHMRSLQAGANLKGAYDARSLCHKVWVPFERDFLDSRLGGSNEPFLNKPARFPSLEKSNPVRAGKDRDMLHGLYDLLESLNSRGATHQREALTYAISTVMRRTGRTVQEISLSPVTLTAGAAMDFFDAFLKKSFGGEVVVATMGALLSLRHGGKKHRIVVHPANQAGASSNEVADIDVFFGDAVELPVEVKDKPFAKADVNHAVEKARGGNCARLLFVLGRQARSAENFVIEELVEFHGRHGFDLAFVDIDTAIRSEVPLIGELRRRKLIQLIHSCLTEMRAKDETKRHFEAALEAARIQA